MLARIPDLWEALRQTVETDLGLKEMVYLGWLVDPPWTGRT